ncbi:MAG: carboxylating nicotinate-nucleotide diphosphorylase [Gemmatimonadetes bacterium]|nr:carboxylating nicotinate-nucleotide diphosphorylase [Gemmatimonadota bacterium]
MRKILGTFDAGVPDADLLDDLIRRALDEDHALDDRSTRPLRNADRIWRGRVLAKEDGVLAGVPVFARVFAMVAESAGGADGTGSGSGAEVSGTGSGDGTLCAAGDDVLDVVGPAGVLLSAERTALNFLQRLSAIAGATRRVVDAAEGRLHVCDTRKTTPGLRALEKYAVVVGGGTSHRWSLGDMVMLKENHLELAGGIAAAVEQVRADARSARLPLTVEVKTYEEAVEAGRLGVDRLLLDNMTLEEMAHIVSHFGDRERPELEASGNVTLVRVPGIATTGVDLVSLGALTHSVRAVDFSFLLGAQAES